MICDVIGKFLNGTLPAVVLTGLGVALGMRFGRRR